MLRFIAEQLVFLDKSLFNKITGWYYNAYAPVGAPAHYHISRKKGHSWSVLPIYIINGYLSYVGVKKSWFNRELYY